MLNEVDRMYIGDVNFVSIVVLCGIVIVLAVIFRELLKSLIESVMANVTTNATNTVNAPA